MLFRGAAWYYARFRPGYAPGLIELLAARAGLGPRSRVLDLGTGTGQLAVPLAAYAAEVVAVDPEPEMLAELVELPNLRAVEARAEEVDETWGHFDLVTIGNAFHWMDPAILDRLPTDQVALCGVDSDRYQAVAREVAQELFGPRPAFRQQARYEQTLAASVFSQVEELHAEVERTWSVDELVGVAFSTSFASPGRLGDRKDEFERELRARLEPFTEQLASYALLGRRGDQ
jgi:SAM-dependent methyltransferase